MVLVSYNLLLKILQVLVVDVATLTAPIGEQLAESWVWLFGNANGVRYRLFPYLLDRHGALLLYLLIVICNLGVVEVALLKISEEYLNILLKLVHTNRLVLDSVFEWKRFSAEGDWEVHLAPVLNNLNELLVGGDVHLLHIREVLVD